MPYINLKRMQQILSNEIEIERDEMEWTLEVYNKFRSSIEGLKEEDILNYKILKKKIFTVNSEYKNIIYNLFLIASKLCKGGLCIVLNADKVNEVIYKIDNSNIFVRLISSKLDKKGIKDIKKLSQYKLNSLCGIVNKIIDGKIVEPNCNNNL